MAELFSGAVDYALLAVRIVLGLVFIIHGWAKLKNLKGTADFLGSLGFKPAMFWAIILSCVEFFGGIAILIGFASRAASGILIISMLVAIYYVIFVWKKQFTQPNGSAGYEFELLIISGLIAVFLLGSGALSIDAWINWSEMLNFPWSLG
jgi:putative oxidoreductase